MKSGVPWASASKPTASTRALPPNRAWPPSKRPRSTRSSFMHGRDRALDRAETPPLLPIRARRRGRISRSRRPKRQSTMLSVKSFSKTAPRILSAQALPRIRATIARRKDNSRAADRRRMTALPAKPRRARSSPPASMPREAIAHRPQSGVWARLTAPFLRVLIPGNRITARTDAPEEVDGADNRRAATAIHAARLAVPGPYAAVSFRPVYRHARSRTARYVPTPLLPAGSPSSHRPRDPSQPANPP